MATLASCFVATISLALASCVAANAQPGTPKQSTLRASKILTGRQFCTTGNGATQFVGEDRLLILVGPGSDCFRTVRELELVVMSTQGRILARKPWPSTFPAVVLGSQRLAVSDFGNVLILDQDLRTVQTLPIPGSSQSSIFLRKQPPDRLIARLPRGEEFALRGNPLEVIGPWHGGSMETIIYAPEDGSRTISLKGQQLLSTGAANDTKVLTDLGWLFNCTSLCQEYDAGTAFSVSSHGPLRAAFISNGSRFPVTDAAGLFPFCRVVVVDLGSGKEIYRKQFITKTGQRSAQISPNGDLLAMSDGDEVDLQPLP